MHPFSPSIYCKPDFLGGGVGRGGGDVPNSDVQTLPGIALVTNMDFLTLAHLYLLLGLYVSVSSTPH